ncbi:ATP synthase gamma chain 2, chloroplastic [Glycine max]|nr:hypothetical protein JHK87_049458 [Glycine soja]KAH1197405.1 ATP synthase gamma chain 2, chloroplastic [Glycine max]
MRLRLLLMMFFWLFVSEEVDQVELVYTKFVSLVRFEPVIQNLLPLGEVCDVKDEIFRLSSKEWKLAVEKDVVKLEKKGISLDTLWMDFAQS